MGFFFQGTQEWVRNSRGKQAICVRAIEVLLYDHVKGSNSSINDPITCTFLSLPGIL